MRDDEARILLDRIGLCATCRHRREQASRRGSVFYRCVRADLDPAFVRYPPLPVRSCRGHESDKVAPTGG